MTGAGSRCKGARGENEVRDLIRVRWPHCRRNFGSGSDGGLDLVDGPEGVLWEVKRTNRLRLRDAWRQAQDGAHGTGRTPVVATRWDHGEWLAVIELEELLALLALRERA